MSTLTVEERLELLEAVVSKNSITLSDTDNPGCQIILNFKDGNFKINSRKTEVTETEFNFTNFQTEG